MRRLILTSMSGTSLYRTDLADAVVCFPFFRFVWGPLPSPDKIATYLGALSDQHGPGEHWSIFAYRWPQGAAGREIELVELCRLCEVVELWFDPNPNDQLQLVWLLDFFHFHPDVVARLRLRLVDFDLISVPSTGLGKRKVQDIGVTGAELETASMAWQAYRATTPEACLALLATDLSPLLLLKPALLNLLAELPSSTTGLGATEMRMLEMIACGFAKTNPLFHFRTLRGKRVFDESELGYLLEGLAHGPTPAVTGLDDELRTLEKSNHRGRHDAYRRSRLSLTEFGKAVVAHKEDFSRHNPIDRWWGGTHLTNDCLWRWNPTLMKPQVVGSK
ncbi:MAG TPA: hypothetical protein VK804_30060 [Bradyrhizobium sp.]|jgi:hypothetical protein|uniref:hypothetical protein n=1 Tax=Bradyrhizobium sp. TaxID=376 RepID=UPI002CA13F42|nr:hypothetical protein [Bradyrhizobium sp.]HTB04735.1 hypothetical protein [Bradyrhizobium sp.]